jgi:predicted  nucleic acid-binding Zn-ribbon protein
MTNEQLIVSQAHEIATLREDLNNYKSWYLKASDEIKKLQGEIVLLKEKLNANEGVSYAQINPDDYPKNA